MFGRFFPILFSSCFVLSAPCAKISQLLPDYAGNSVVLLSWCCFMSYNFPELLKISNNCYKIVVYTAWYNVGEYNSCVAHFLILCADSFMPMTLYVRRCAAWSNQMTERETPDCDDQNIQKDNRHKAKPIQIVSIARKWVFFEFL